MILRWSIVLLNVQICWMMAISCFFIMMPYNLTAGPQLSVNSYFKTALQHHLGNFNAAHLNCQSIKPSANCSKFDELNALLTDGFFDVFAVTETWLKPYITCRAVEIPGFNICRNDRLNSRGGGVALYISSGIKYRKVFKTSELGICESLFVELYLNNTVFLFGVVYLPHGDICSFEYFHHDLFLSYNNIIIVGDYNCNLFDTVKSNYMRSLCFRLNLAIVHNSKPTHYDIAHGSTSLIDYWLVSDFSMVCLSDQIRCPSISHHEFLFASFVMKIEKSKEYVEFHDFKSIEWDNLLGLLSNFDCSHFYSGDVDDQCHSLTSLLNLLFSCVPVVKKRICRKNINWMKCKEILFAQSLRDLAYRAYLSDRSDSNWRVFCKLRNKAKNVIRRVKRLHFSKVFWGLDSSALWTVLRGAGCVGIDSMTYEGDINELNDFFVSGNSTNSNINLTNFDNSIDSFSFHCIDEMELIEALNKVKSNSVGTDNISIRFVKLVYPYISNYILHLINSILTTSTFPKCWKMARVVPLPKSVVVHGPEDFRPISILPALSKVVEHVIRNQMLESVLNCIYVKQYAFRSGFSTTSLLLSLTDKIRNNVNNNEFSVLISLDLSKAFNNINHCQLIYKLRNEFNFSKSACKLILSYLDGRSQFVQMNGVSSGLRHLLSGVPQGSVLGPLLFILYVNSLPSCVNSMICDSFLFADDVFLLFRSGLDFKDVLISNINFCLRSILEWTSDNSLCINPNKTKAIMFGPTNRFFADLNIFLGDVRIDFVDQLKCLGVMLDCKLSFAHHIDLLSFRVFGILRKLYSTNLYLPSRVRYKLAYALLMSQILYGFEVITGTSAMYLNRIRRLINAVVRFVYNIRIREHISSHVLRFLHCSFYDFVNFRNMIFFYRVIKNCKPLPLYCSFMFTRSIRNPQILIPRISSSFMEKSFLVRIARWWNVLPYYLRTFSQSNNVFKLKLLQFFNSGI
ncbi:RNA-directed DNA polymerase from mobile element jockey [Lucilia cuprina]|nr:RNA-directed DNA polymerase from mobile element jockey [Lucilia cuprina]KAI8128211.1 RNA-directed DNA polymerase from mobile element jockey [Lucilia cuprina]